MARVAAPAGAVGVDQSAARLAQARELAAGQQLRIEFIEGDAKQLPFPGGSFDFAWSRFLLQYLPNPELALGELIRVTRTGGIVAVADLDGQIEQFYPLDPFVQTGLEKALQLMRGFGFDARLGRKLYNLFYKAGLREIKVDVAPYQVYAGGLPDRDWQNWIVKVDTTVDVLIERTGEREYWSKVRDGFREQLKSEGLFYYCTLILVRGGVPEA